MVRGMARRNVLARALEDLGAIAAVARSAPGAARIALKRADRIDRRLDELGDAIKPAVKRLAGMQRELEAIDKRLAKLNRRMDRNVEANRRTAKATESMDGGVS